MDPATPPWLISPQRSDLAEIARELDAQFDSTLPTGYLQGKTALRDALMDAHPLSALDAERLVDALQMQGFLRYSGDPTATVDPRSRWLLVPNGVDVGGGSTRHGHAPART